MREGGLLLDRESAWLEGGDTDKAIVPGDPEASLLIAAVKFQRDDLHMPPDEPLPADELSLLEAWIRIGAPGPRQDMGETEFARLGDQSVLMSKAEEHWAFQQMRAVKPPEVGSSRFAQDAIDRFIAKKWESMGLSPSAPADGVTLAKRLYFSLNGLPPKIDEVRQFEERYHQQPEAAVVETVDRLINEPAFGQHFARMWLDVARYADTDSFYRPDTRTPHYFPFAFTYRDYVVDAFNEDKPYDQFILEQFAADLIGFKDGDPELAALGFFGVAPHANRSQAEALDDWIDVSTQGLMGVTVACARCHDHKYEPVPTTDYYALRGVFASLDRPSALDLAKLPAIRGYHPSSSEKRDFEQKLAAIEKRIGTAGNSRSNNNNQSVATKIRETELAELLLFHPGGPAHAMIVTEKKKRPSSYVFERGDPTSPGAASQATLPASDRSRPD